MIKLEDVSKKFNKNQASETVLYEGLNLKIDEGEFVTVIGSNGSGKSTLLNILCGQVSVDGGTIFINNKMINKEKSHNRFKHISRVYQDPKMGTAPSLTVVENLSLAWNKGNLFNFKTGKQKDKINYFKEQLRTLGMGLEKKLEVQVGQLSGGQRQALSLFMATMNNPQVLLLDEHTAALDPKSSDTIMTLTNKIVKEHKMTTVMVTHNLQHALDYGDRLIMFHKGKVIFDVKGDDKKNLSIPNLITLFKEYEGIFAETL